MRKDLSSSAGIMKIPVSLAELDCAFNSFAEMLANNSSVQSLTCEEITSLPQEH